MKFKAHLPGLFLIIVICLLALVINEGLKAWLTLETLTIGIILGIIYNNTIKTHERYFSGINFAQKHLLKLGIVLLGFKLQFMALAKLGPQILLMILCFVPLVLFLSWGIGKLLNISLRESILLGVGSSICGASAIVALAPVIQANDDETIVSVSVINFLGAIGILVYAFLFPILEMTQIEYGVWAGLSLQGVAHALAAAFAGGVEAGEIGTLVKMGRVAMLLPVALVLSFLFHKLNATPDGTKPEFPRYVLLFLIAGVLNSIGVVPLILQTILVTLSKWLILLAIVGMGLAVDLRSIKEQGLKVILAGSVVFFITGVMALYVVQLLI